MTRLLLLLCLTLSLLLVDRPAWAFCGFYVAKADTKLFNKASSVVLVRDEDKTVITMASDFRGDVKEFAMVVPVPTLLTREQIHVGAQALLEHLDAYSAPRLVEYFDPNPCQARLYEFKRQEVPASPASKQAMADRAATLGVTVEAQYTIGEYDIVLLSATQSEGLETWLQENGYRIPKGAARVIGSYLKQGMRFFVAKVNLDEHGKLGYAGLRPLQLAFESPKFMLPIRLGTVNADGPQELFIYAITRKGRVETTNYRTIKLPSDKDLPVYVKEKFQDFYRDLFAQQVKRQDFRGVFLEYAWDMNWCDPCAANPLTREELRRLGAFWLFGAPSRTTGGADAFLTRLHVRYDAEHFPEDLMFQETGDRQHVQARYILRHAWNGEESCSNIDEYRAMVRRRQEQEAATLASLTGWSITDIRHTMKLDGGAPGQKKWYERIWED